MKHGQIVSRVIAILAFILATSPVFAGYPTLIGVELGGMFNRTQYDMGEVKYYLNHEGSFYADTRSSDSFGPVNQWDARFGFRVWHFVTGFQYSATGETSHGIEYVPAGMNDIWEGPITINAKAKEYLIYLGYLQPVLPWMDVMIVGAFGWGDAIAEKKEIENTFMGTREVIHSLDGNYNPSRIEGRLRFHVRYNMVIETAVGYRDSYADEMKGHVSNMSDLQEYYIVYGEDDRRLEFDYSGIYYGVGITLISSLTSDALTSIFY